MHTHVTGSVGNFTMDLHGRRKIASVQKAGRIGRVDNKGQLIVKRQQTVACQKRSEIELHRTYLPSLFK